MMTLNQLAMHNLAPRGIKGTCVPTSLAFVTGECYQDLDHLFQSEQSHYRRGQRVKAQMLLGYGRRIGNWIFSREIVQNFCTLGMLQSVNRIGTYVVVIPGHMLVLKDGEFYDLCATNLRSKVIAMWKAEKA